MGEKKECVGHLGLVAVIFHDDNLWDLAGSWPELREGVSE